MRVDLLGVVAAASLVQVLGQQADGGFRGSTPRDCDTDWSYRTNSEDTLVEAITGCLNIMDHPPYNSLGDQEETPLFDPQDVRTDTTQWCSFKQNKQGEGNAIYDLSGDLDKITSWGYCLRIDGTAAPTSNDIVTLAPTSSELTGPFPKADGGFQTEIVNCDAEWTYRDDSNGGLLIEGITGCLNGDLYPPYQFGTDSVVQPSLAGTNTTFWCSTKSLSFSNSVYNVNPGDDEDESKRKAWGFCLEESAVTTGSIAPTVSGTAAPVGSVNTVSPVSAPTTGTTSAPPTAPSNPGATVSPSVMGTASPTDIAGNIVPTTQAPTGGLTSGAIAAAVVVPLIVVFALVGGFAYYKYSNGSGAAGAGGAAEEPTKEEVAKDPENGQDPMEELRVD